jgi:RNA polymerase sigma factor (sigma-70 family)
MSGGRPLELAELVIRARHGDARAFEALVRLLQDAAVGYAWGILRDRARAEEAAQEAFLEAYLRLAELEEPSAFAPWLRAIVRSKCARMTRRKELPSARLNILEVAAPEPNPLEQRMHAEERRDLLRALEGLTEDERTVVTLFYMAEIDQAQIAGFLAVPVSIVKNRLYRARKRLKGLLMSDLERELKQQRPSRDGRFERRVALFRALDANDASALEHLLQADPSVVHERRRRDEDPPEGVRWGLTPLHVACCNGSLELAKQLIAAGADLEARATGHDDHAAGGTPLHWASAKKRLDVVKLLVERGANLNPAEDAGMWGSDQSFWADRPIAEYLVEHGAQITIFSAVVLERESVVRALVAADPSVLHLRLDQAVTAMTPLHIAARENLPRMIDVLFGAGASAETTDKLDRNPVDVALLAGHRAAYERLVSHGSLPTKAALERASPIDRAVTLRRFFDLCVARAWYAHLAPDDGANLTAIEVMLDSEPWITHATLPYFWPDNYVGATPLHLASAVGRKDVADLLLARGASRTVRDARYGGTPANWAHEFNRPEMLAFLEGWEDPSER